MTVSELIDSPVQGIARGLIRDSLNAAPALDLLSQRSLINYAPQLDGLIRGEQPGAGTFRLKQPGRCVVGDGVGAHVVGPTGLITTGDFSISCWIYVASLASVDEVLGMGNPFTASGTGVVAYFSTAGAVVSLISDGGASGVSFSSVTGSITASSWSHICVTYDRDGSGKIYVNGVQSGTPVSIAAASGTIANGALNLLKYGSSAIYSSARMFDFRIYDSVLTATEVQQLYTLGSDALPNKPTALHLKLDDKHPTIAYDSSGNKRHGTKTTWNVSANHYEGADVPFSWENDKGFTESDGTTYYTNDDGTGLIGDGIRLPRLESDKSKCAAYLSDGTRAALQYTGECPNNHTLIESNCGTFNGSSYFVDVGDISASVKTISLWLKADDITAHTDYLLDLNGTDYITIVNGEVTTNGFSGATVTIYVDGVEDATIPDTTSFHHVAIVCDTGFSASDIDIGRLEGTGFFDGSLCGVRVFTDELTAAEVLGEYSRTGATLDNCAGYWPFSEGGESTNIADVVAGNDGTATSIATGTFWGTKQSVFFYNGVYGCSRYTHATTGTIYVPYDMDGTPHSFTPPAGYSLENDCPAGPCHNNCESGIDWKGGVDYPPKNWVRPRNLLTFSESFDNAAWVKTRCSVTPNAIEAPDGTITADRIVSDNSAATTHLVARAAIATTSGQTHTFSVYAKFDTSYTLRLRAIGQTDVSAYFDLSAGTVLSGDGAIEIAGGGWYRCSVSFTGNANDAVYAYLADGTNPNPDGDNATGIYVWGAQLVKGTDPGTYTPSDWSDDPPRNWRMPNEMLSNRAFSGAVAGTPGTAPTGWTFGLSGGTLGVSGSVLTFTTSSARHYIYQNQTLRSGNWYVLEMDVTVVSGTVTPGEIAYVYNLTIADSFYTLDGVGTLSTTAFTGTKTLRLYYKPGATGTAAPSIGAGVTGVRTQSVSISNPSFKPWLNKNPEYYRLTTKNGVPYRADRLTRYDQVLIGTRAESAESYTQNLTV